MSSRPLMDHGGGTLEAFAKIVAEALCVPLDKVNSRRRARAPRVYDVVTHATRGVYAGGGAVLKATQKVREDLLADGGRFLNVQPEALTLRLDEALGQGVVYVPSIPDKQMTDRRDRHPLLDRQLEDHRQRGELPARQLPARYVIGVRGGRGGHLDGRGAHGAAVMGSDCGTVINPVPGRGPVGRRAVEGRGLCALREQRVGRRRASSAPRAIMVDGKVPGSTKARAWTASPRTSPTPTSRAARSAPKASARRRPTPSPAAYANAIRDAIGVRFYELPITPEKILAAMRDQGLETRNQDESRALRVPNSQSQASTPSSRRRQ